MRFVIIIVRKEENKRRYIIYDSYFPSQLPNRYYL